MSAHVGRKQQNPLDRRKGRQSRKRRLLTGTPGRELLIHTGRRSINWYPATTLVSLGSVQWHQRMEVLHWCPDVENLLQLTDQSIQPILY